MGVTRIISKKKAATTTTGSSGWIRCGSRRVALRLARDCDNASAGTNPTADITVETNAVGSDTGKRSVGGMTAFTQVTGSGGGVQRRTVTDLDEFVKVTWTIGGTASPSFALGVTGDLVEIDRV